MSLTPGLQLPFGIQLVNPVPVDSWSGPYIGSNTQNVIDSANLAIPIEIRFQSMEVRLIVSGIAKKFWYRDGVSDIDLVEFVSSGSATTSIPTLQEVTDIGSTTNNSIEVTGFGDERVFMSNSAYIQVNNVDSTEVIQIEPNMVSFGKGGFSHNLIVGTVTGANTYQLPDQSGIIALLSDIGGGSNTLEQVLIAGSESTTQNATFRLSSTEFLKINRAGQVIEIWDFFQDPNNASTRMGNGYFYTKNFLNSQTELQPDSLSMVNGVSGFTAQLTGGYLSVSDGTNYISLTYDSFIFDNNSYLGKGTVNYGFGGGISQVCAAGKEKQWENGVEYQHPIGGSNVYAETMDNIVPDTSYDVTKNWVVGSTFKNLVTGDIYKCSDAATASAVWDLVTGIVPSLQQVIDVNGYVEKDGGNSYIQALEGSVDFRVFEAFLSSDSNTIHTEFYLTKNNINFYNHLGGSAEGGLNVDDGKVLLFEKNLATTSAAATYVKFNLPTNSTQIFLPAKTVDGDYTLATLDDIVFSIPTLKEVLATEGRMPFEIVSDYTFDGPNKGGSIIVATSSAVDLFLEDGVFVIGDEIEIYNKLSTNVRIRVIGIEASKIYYKNEVIDAVVFNTVTLPLYSKSWLKCVDTDVYELVISLNNSGNQTLQQVTNIGNTSSNSILVTSDGDTREVSVTSASGVAILIANDDTVFTGARNGAIAIGFEPRNNSVTYTSISTGRSQWIRSNITGVTSSSWAQQYFYLPTKPNNSYTLATLDDIGAPIISATYGAIQTLVEANGLIVGSTYILLEYQTIYQINGSNTTGIVQLHTVIGQASGYSQFVNVPSEIGGPGNFAGVTVTVAEVVPGSTLTVGQSLTISIWFSSSYIQFSPTVVGVNVGCTLKFEKQRYSNVTPGITYSDIYGKPIMKPGGVLNTEVHDGTPYMSMTASENPTVLTESIILKAIDINKFSRDAESLTFPGDKLIYDYTNNIIYDENGNFRSNKPGTILQRSNISGTIVMNKDWRVQRYRRYGVDSTNWSKLTLATASVYKIGANSECTITNASITSNHKYIASDPYIDNFFNDFSKNTDNVFLTGTNSAPSMAAGERANYQLSGYEYMNVLNIASFTSSVKDFNIIPIVSGQPTILTTKCIINNVNNTVFLPYSQTYGTTFNLNVESKNGDITNSTFASLPKITNTGKINKLTVIDHIILNNFSTYNDREDNAGSILNSLMLSYASFANTGEIVNTTIGGGNGFSSAFNNIQFINSSLYNCIIGGHRNSNMILENFKGNKSLICFYGSTLMTITGKTYLTALKNSSTSSYSSNIKLNTFNSVNPNKALYGYLYDFSVSLSDMEINNMTLDKRMVYQYLDNSNVLISTTVSIAQ